MKDAFFHPSLAQKLSSTAPYRSSLLIKHCETLIFGVAGRGTER